MRIEINNDYVINNDIIMFKTNLSDEKTIGPTHKRDTDVFLARPTGGKVSCQDTSGLGHIEAIFRRLAFWGTFYV